MQVLTTAPKPHRYWDRRFPRMLSDDQVMGSDCMHCLPHQLSDDQVMASDCMLIAFLISSPMTR